MTRVPRALMRGVALAEGADKTVAPARKVYHGAGSQAKGSPKGGSPIPGAASMAPKVATDRQAQARDLSGQCDGPAPASKIAEAWGQPRHLPGLVVLCLQLRPSPTSKNNIGVRDSEIRTENKAWSDGAT